MSSASMLGTRWLSTASLATGKMGSVRRELVFTAHPGRADLARRITLAEAGLKERADLQEWIRAHPQILGRGVRIVTYEFDRWMSGTGSRAADRLDLLGL